MHIVLHQPEIPSNTGNIGRTCVATSSSLHLIEPLGFRLNEKELKRAGMDYWEKLDVTRYVNFAEFQERHPGAKIWMATTKAKRSYTEVSFGAEDYIMFGKESAGIPEEILVEHEETCIRIPMLADIRSLNLSNAVAIVLYEALRQNGFAGLEKEGELHRLKWKQEEAGRPCGLQRKQEEAGRPYGLQQKQEEEGTHGKEGKFPQSVFVAPGAAVVGNVTLGEDCGVWYHATIRAERNAVTIGKGSNIQDNCVVHVGLEYPVSIGEYVTVGHGAILHGCTIGDRTLIGMGAILMNGCRIGSDCIIGAGALVTGGMVIPDHSLVLGSPGQVKRAVTEEEARANYRNALRYMEFAREHASRFWEE